MNAMPAEEFRELCLDYLQGFLVEYGYSYLETHVRPRGVAVEFADNGERRLFAVWEGDVVYMELILPIEEDAFCRVSLNQALWFLGVRAVVKQGRSCGEKLSLFVQELPRCCNDILLGDLRVMDSRYCYRISRKECEDYLNRQRR